MDETLTLLKSPLERTIEKLFILTQLDVPAMLWGDPGTGKSSLIKAIGRSLGLHTVVFVGNKHDPSDLGQPYIDADGVAHEAKIAWVQDLAARGKGLVFFDELTTCSPAMQAAMLTPIQDRRIGEIDLPKGVILIGAGNPPETAANGIPLAAPMVSRMTHLTMARSHLDWIEGELHDWPDPETLTLPADWRKHVPAAKLLVSSYIAAHADALNRPPTTEVPPGQGYPTDRGWSEFVIPILAACASLGYTLKDQITHELVAGAVGKGDADALREFARLENLPDPEAWIADPSLAKPLERSDITYLAVMGVTKAVLVHTTAARWEAAMRCVVNVGKQGNKDVGVAAMRLLFKNRPEGANDLAGVASVYGQMFKKVA